MTPPTRLHLVPQTREQVRAQIVQMSAPEKAQLSKDWLALLDSSSPADPWIHGFHLMHQTTGQTVGTCGFKGPPVDGLVEIAYCIAPELQGQGYATEAAGLLLAHAFHHPQVRTVRAHTLPTPNASTRVLEKSGFQKIGEVVDPDDGPVWRWEKPKE